MLFLENNNDKKSNFVYDIHKEKVEYKEIDFFNHAVYIFNVNYKIFNYQMPKVHFYIIEK